MQKASLGERLRYWFDNFFARGTISLVLGLFVVSALVILGVAIIVTILGVARGVDWDFPYVLWNALLRTLDPGTMGGDQGPLPFVFAMLFTTFIGLFVVSALIGIINTGIEAKLTELRKGRSRVIESGHTVILGWSQQVFTIVAELVVANANHRNGRIVILADRDKVEMEDEIRLRVPEMGRTKVVCRRGSPVDIDDLEIASIHSSKSIILLSPEDENGDADVIKTLLAITNNPRRRPEPYHVVAEVRDPANLDVGRMVGRDEAELVLVGDLIARIVAQTCRQSGLSVVYTELLDFGGDEIYFANEPSLVGRPFGDTLLAFEESTVIGIAPVAGGAQLSPPMNRVIEAGDRLVVISEDDDTIKVRATPLDGARRDLIVPATRRTRVPERTLILGWNWRAPAIIDELDNYVAPGSHVQVVADVAGVDDALADVTPNLRNITVDARRGDTTDRRVLDALDVQRYDHLIILCYSDLLDPQRADARTLITLLHLREISAEVGHDFSITSEMLDLRNRALAEVTRADDFIVSDRLTSLLITQISEDKALRPVFDDLFDPEGAEVYLRPIGEYVQPNQPMTFETVVEAARQRGEVAIGYRHIAQQEDASASYGVKLNPRKTVPITFAQGDRVVVIAEDGFEENLMPGVAIITDSAADLTPDRAAGARIRVVPLIVNFGRESFRAGVDLSTEAFWARMTAPDAPFPTTAASSPGTFQEAFEAAFADGADAIVCVNVAESLSATIKSARIAADMLPKRTIAVVDSGTASMGIGLLALMASELAAAGRPAKEIAATLERRRGDIDLFVALDTLEYLKGGRISGAQAAIGTLLSVKPIITVTEGKVETADRVRTRGKARERVLELLSSRPLERLAVLFTPPADANAFRDELVKRIPGGIDPANVTVQPVGSSVGPHLGPGCIGAVVLVKPAAGAAVG